MRPLVMISRLSVSGRFRGEISDFVAWATAWRLQNPEKILDLQLTKMVGIVPAPVARNRTVNFAKMQHADFLLMIDDDMLPDPNFFPVAVEFLRQHPGPAAIAMPYCCGGPHEEVMAFEWEAMESYAASGRFRLIRIPRPDAARRTGIGRVMNMGTGCVMYNMECFNAYQPPYYDYSYNPDHTEVVETEDCYCHRHLVLSGIPLYVDWDHWGGHDKQKMVPKPQLLEQKDIDTFYVDQAEALLRARGQQKPSETIAQQPTVSIPGHDGGSFYFAPQAAGKPCDINGVLDRGFMPTEVARGESDLTTEIAKQQEFYGNGVAVYDFGKDLGVAESVMAERARRVFPPQQEIAAGPQDMVESPRAEPIVLPK